MRTEHSLPYPVTIVRSPRRRSACININSTGEVEVRIPKRFPKKELQRFLLESETWVQKKLSKLSQIRAPKKQFIAGEEFFVLGIPSNLCLTEKAPKRIHFDGDAFFSSHTEPEKLKGMITKWYRNKAAQVFERRLQHYATVMNLKHSELKVKEYTARWGTCFPDGSIALNWRLMMAPIEVLDYVVVHELAHLKYNGHGKRFWALVEKHLPNYKDRIKKLEEWSSELYSF